MTAVSNAQLHAYLDDALDDPETARIEKLIRDSLELQKQLDLVRQERDRGEHSLGAVWRRERLSCLTREQLTGYLHGILDADVKAYIEFHLKTITCSSCLANLDDLREKQAEAPTRATRTRRFFQTSAGYLKEQKK